MHRIFAKQMLYFPFGVLSHIYIYIFGLNYKLVLIYIESKSYTLMMNPVQKLNTQLLLLYWLAFMALLYQCKPFKRITNINIVVYLKNTYISF